MIVRYESDGSLVMITQNDHAQLSGLFAAHWGNEKFEKPRPYPSLVRAAMFHDRGWIRYETSPQINLETGKTDSYTEQFLAACNDFDRAAIVAQAKGMN